MKIPISILFILTILSTSAWAETYRLKRDDGSDITYYIERHPQVSSKILLVLIQGSDCNSVKNNQFIIENFGQVIGVSDILLVEKYGLNEELPYETSKMEREDCPLEYLNNDSPLQRVNDYVRLLNGLKNQYPNIVLLGGSEGATIANLVAEKLDFIKASVAINGGGALFIDDVIFSMRHQFSGVEQESAINQFKTLIQDIKDKKIPADTIIGEHSSLWWDQMTNIDSEAILAKTQTPTLVIQTLNDVNVNTEQLLIMKDKITNPNVSFKIYDNLDHYFKNKDNEPNTETINQDINAWYKQIIVATK
nr:acyl-CoA thioester hydrolase/BAAT C-terminal domain-containing protein [uncultured Moellerella sp.]